MSKIDTLKEKYTSITPSVFNYFVNADQTPTKKYAEYMLKMWESKLNQFISPTKIRIVEAVNKFDDLLPYIENKDIYSNEYKSFQKLLSVIEKSEAIREEKTFVKEKNIIVIKETDTYVLLNPITHVGSIKYGANTKWCTASRYNQQQFIDYNKGYLVYLIDKTGKKSKGYEKIAFYSGPNSGFTDSYLKYNTIDTRIDEKKLLINGWSADELLEIDLYFRKFIITISEFRNTKKNIDRTIRVIKDLDFVKLKCDIQKFNAGFNFDVEELVKNVNSFNDNIKNYYKIIK